MKEILINCTNIDSEKGFWVAYLQHVKPDGAEYFGRNLNAFWDALSSGGPGWPGDDEGCIIRFTNTRSVKRIRGGKFYESLQEIAKELSEQEHGSVSIEVE